MQDLLNDKYYSNGWVEIITDLKNENIEYYELGEEKYENRYSAVVVYKILHPNN